jgi:RimJ/RimL family protein N-acetyltransferase
MRGLAVRLLKTRGPLTNERAQPEPAEKTRAPAYLVQELTDPATIRRFLEPRRSYAAYALAQLDPALFPDVRCWQSKGSTGQALVLFSGGGLGDALFAMGESGALEALLRLHRGPRYDYATCQPQHVPVLRRYFNVGHEQPMLRMAVERDSFVAVGPLPAGVKVRRLSGLDAPELNRLYNTEGMPAYYTAAHLREGVYFGVYEQEQLVAAAGTHAVSHELGIAVVGNVFTHPQRRGRGYARFATGTVTAMLLQDCRDVVLTVDPDNTPAVRAYRRLGYQDACQLVEAAVVRRDITGLASWNARLLARYRGRRHGAELVLG